MQFVKIAQAVLIFMYNNLVRSQTCMRMRVHTALKHARTHTHTV